MVRSVALIGVPLDLGANVRGANMGPAAIRNAEILKKIERLGINVVDFGDIDIPLRETLRLCDAEKKFRPQIDAVTAALYKLVTKALKKDHLPIVLGGDHSLAVGSVSAVHDHLASKNQDLGLIWIDAHADMNTQESSQSGNLHGMPLATLLGLDEGGVSSGYRGSHKVQNIKPANTVLLGIRDLDEFEQKICKSSGIRYYTMRQIDERGIHAVISEALADLNQRTSGLHISFDLDGMDPLWAPGVSTPVSGGLSYREALHMFSLVSQQERLVSMDLVELNGRFDSDQISANFLIEAALTLLGKTIL